MNRLFLKEKNVVRAAFLLVVALFYAPMSGAANHYCFDGMEPPVSIHFDNLTGHDGHDDEKGHVDLEKLLLDDNLVGKFSDLVALPETGTVVEQAHYEPASLLPVSDFIPVHSYCWQLNPPLRAPPQAS